MGVGLVVGDEYAEFGDSSFVHCFFSTISHHLEPNGWGSMYPELMNELYQGEMSHEHAEKAINDVNKIQELLKSYPPSAVIWDIEDLKQLPPWGDNISDEITDLSNYFVTSDGEDVFDVLLESLETLKAQKSGSIRIE